jgi:V-type H+-transporting ATPase subunit a
MDGYDNHNIAKPTWFKTNEVTATFQEIVDTYGTPNYLEANPALLSIVSFPFMFGMMFGDMGHGSLLLLAALILVFGADRMRENGNSYESLLSVRYLFLFMGMSATYCGFIYNEFFAIQTNIFSSCYDLENRYLLNPTLSDDGLGNDDSVGLADETYIYVRKSHDCNYAMGQDPVWALS